jgi:hypothetical protein
MPPAFANLYPLTIFIYQSIIQWKFYASAEKGDAFKWLNELAHRIWNIKFDLQRGEDNDSITRLYDNMKFYGEQSALLKMHLVPTTLGAFKNFKAKQ